jgi:hypothetical protein
MGNDYYLYRRKIRSGDLLVWSHGSGGLINGIILTTIKLFTLSEYVHVGVAWKTAGRLFVVEATLDGVKISPLSKKGSFFHIPMNLKWTKEYDCLLLSKIGEPYSIHDAITGYLGILKPGSNDAWQCAELVHSFYAHIGLDLGNAHTPTKIVNNTLVKGYMMTKVNQD